MGFLDLFKKNDTDQKKPKNTKLSESVKKTLEAKNISVSLDDDGKGSFELVMPKEGYSLYPYYRIDTTTKELSIIINVRNVEEDITIDLYNKINAFNIKSKYLMAKLKDRIIYLEYNTKVDSHKSEIIHEVIESVFMLSKEIDEL